MRTFRTPLVLLTAVAATLLTGCGEKPGSNLASGTPTGPSYVIGADTPTDADVSPSPTQTTPADGGDNGGSNGGEQRNDPWIEYFRIKQKPHCPSGQWPNGREVIVEWKVTGTDKVTLSVDGAGIYDTYDASGSETFSFSCGDWGPGETAKHTYLLMTVGGGPVAKKTITATATVSGGSTSTPSPAAQEAAPLAP